MSLRQEKGVAKSQVGGRLVAGSGSTQHAKGDVKTRADLIECKATAGKTFVIHAAVLAKIKNEAHRASKEPGLVIASQGKQLAVIDYWVFRERMGALKLPKEEPAFVVYTGQTYRFSRADWLARERDAEANKVEPLLLLELRGEALAVIDYEAFCVLQQAAIPA